MSYRIGLGYDIHRLVEGRRLVLGGVKIPFAKGLLGHSDADVLIHALCDALLGALGEKDIGELFPDAQAKYHNISSVELLKAVDHLVREAGYRVNNIDAVIIVEEPALSPFKMQMKENLARALNIGLEAVNVKGKTNEGLGEIGKKEAIACYAIASLLKGE
ncbi:MAG: 2-C-methyl-D-erythritol 2,4-cyclodiphosphate synthase [Candidatus Omnitrophota bacterium]